ncbi:hypothetical protein [Arthrobacter glacialis]|uniref:Uncharacterized protein n=1 Tax=Arthrobacter glacialis TaxID=1664 RepID=A0A2S4A138_ARTGL|nr:hypothetical protein [Arthrobacter glacialis]POH75193.1 hypothetical protein CVS27_00850 [Arthrobacter glacialis]
MTAHGNARDYADGFVYFQSSIRRPTEIDETMARLRDLLLLRTAVSELLREEVGLLSYEPSPATDAVLAQLLQDVSEADTEMHQNLTVQLTSAPDGGDGE